MGLQEWTLKFWSRTSCRKSHDGWLATIARSTAVDAIRRGRPNAALSGTSVHGQLQDVAEHPESSEHELRRELDRQAFRWAHQ